MRAAFDPTAQWGSCLDLGMCAIVFPEVNALLRRSEGTFLIN